MYNDVPMTSLGLTPYDQPFVIIEFTAMALLFISVLLARQLPPWTLFIYGFIAMAACLATPLLWLSFHPDAATTLDPSRIRFIVLGISVNLLLALGVFFRVFRSSETRDS